MVRASFLLILASLSPSIALYIAGLVTGEAIYSSIALGALALPGLALLLVVIACLFNLKERSTIREIVAAGEYPDSLVCGQCRQQTTALKQFRLPQFLLFIGIFGAGQAENYQACAKCMRRSIIWRYLGNLLPGNLVTLTFTPIMIIQWLRSYSTWHSPSVVQRASGKASHPGIKIHLSHRILGMIVVGLVVYLGDRYLGIPFFFYLTSPFYWALRGTVTFRLLFSALFWIVLGWWLLPRLVRQFRKEIRQTG